MANLDIDLGEPRKPKANKAISLISRFQRLAIMGFAVLAIVLFLVWLADPLRDPTVGPAGNNPIEVGGEAFIQGPNPKTRRESLYVATSFEALEELRKTILAGDVFGLADAAVARKVFRVQGETRALVLENHLLSCKLRVLDGIHKGEIAWVDREMVSGIEK